MWHLGPALPIIQNCFHQLSGQLVIENANLKLQYFSFYYFVLKFSRTIALDLVSFMLTEFCQWLIAQLIERFLSVIPVMKDPGSNLGTDICSFCY
jgi:hypothetical protein